MGNIKVRRLKLVKPRSVKFEDCKMEVRDIRYDYHRIDNIFIDKWARLCGVYAGMVYLSLCRHANYESQSCFPSGRLISDELNISLTMVKRGIAILEYYGLIKVDRTSGVKNIYWLIKSEKWKKDPKEFFKVGRIRKATRVEKSKVEVSSS
jgi:hypothetical protein